MRKDLPLSKRFNNTVYKRFILLAKISDVLDMETILINLNCVENVDGTLFFTNAGALFFRNNEEDVKYRHAGIVCDLYKGIEKANIIDAKELNRDIVSNIDDAMIFKRRKNDEIIDSNKPISINNSDGLAIENDELAIENSDRNSIITNFIKKNGKVKNEDLAKLLKLSNQRVRQILYEMVKNNLLEKHGDKRYTYYVMKNN